MKANSDRHADRLSTSNLKKHTEGCFGADVVAAWIKGAADPSKVPGGSIFAAFAGASRRPITVTHRAHTRVEARTHIVHWIAEANHPLRIVEDRKLKELLGTGRPGHNIPSR
ncbi:hypothetical protein GGX14DRAFT_351358 [Mycena pura]|uniref:Uncharacterized protein n=1 Tax=Mycena pura TaxID=153505 RepID=A0AAD6YMY9_9AGAR|nr:hypothetical protein GGX14DRAFT_351358 [Mycena pura]